LRANLAVCSVDWEHAWGMAVIHVFHKASKSWHVFIFNSIHSLHKICRDFRSFNFVFNTNWAQLIVSYVTSITNTNNQNENAIITDNQPSITSMDVLSNKQNTMFPRVFKEHKN